MLTSAEGGTLMAGIIWVDPAELHVPPTRMQGADPAKLHRQIARHGKSLAGMPPLEVTRGKDGRFQINNGVTRATRAAKLCPGQLVPIEVLDDCPALDLTRFPLIKDVLPWSRLIDRSYSRRSLGCADAIPIGGSVSWSRMSPAGRT